MKKFVKIILNMLLILILSTTYVKAEDEACKITLSANKTTLNPGDEVTITLNMSNITKSSGIYQFISLLNYESDIFEIVTVEDSALKQDLQDSDYGECDIIYSGQVDTDISIANPWYLLYIEESGMYGVIGSSIADPQKQDQIVGKIRLKVKNTAPSKTTEVALSTTEVFDAEAVTNGATSGDIITDSKITLTVNGTGGGYSQEPAPTQEPISTQDPIQTQDPISTQEENYATIRNNTQVENKVVEQKENKSTEDVPYTGIEDYIPFIFILLVLGTIGYINYRRYKDI